MGCLGEQNEIRRVLHAVEIMKVDQVAAGCWLVLLLFSCWYIVSLLVIVAASCMQVWHFNGKCRAIRMSVESYQVGVR